MEQQHFDDAQRAMRDLRAGIELRRRGEAATLEAICDLAVAYRLDEEDVFLDAEAALKEKLIRPAGEGTPYVSEFVVMELAAAMRCSQASAADRILGALSLKYRYPQLWEAVQNQELEAWLAEKAALLCRDLHPMVAEPMTGRWLVAQYGLAPGPALTLLKKMIIEADREAAAKKEAEARDDRGFFFRELEDGVLFGSGRFDALEGRFIDARLDELARLIAPLYPKLDQRARRAKALYLAMNPHRLLELQRRLENQAQLEGLEPVLDPADACRTCGDPLPAPLPAPVVSNAPAEASRSQVQVVVHVGADAVGSLDPAARLEKAGWLTASLLGELLGQGLADGDLSVKVLPVIDLPQQPTCDGYQPSDRMRLAVALAHPIEVFPFSNRTRGLDLDHTVSYQQGRRGQTCLDNLAPLTRRVHRAKTRGAWVMDHKGGGHFRWVSPLGYVYEVTDGATFLVCTPDLGPPREHARG